jgi:hypothetical protein
MSGNTRTPHPNALPDYRNATIPPDKLIKYALNPKHIAYVWGKSSGSDKARVFKRALGFDLSNWEILRDKILAELPYHEAILGHEDEYGRRYNVTLPILGANVKMADVLTAWIITEDDGYPTLTTLLVK